MTFDTPQLRPWHRNQANSNNSQNLPLLTSNGDYATYRETNNGFKCSSYPCAIPNSNIQPESQTDLLTTSTQGLLGSAQISENAWGLDNTQIVGNVRRYYSKSPSGDDRFNTQLDIKSSPFTIGAQEITPNINSRYKETFPKDKPTKLLTERYASLSTTLNLPKSATTISLVGKEDYYPKSGISTYAARGRVTSELEVYSSGSDHVKLGAGVGDDSYARVIFSNDDSSLKAGVGVENISKQHKNYYIEGSYNFQGIDFGARYGSSSEFLFSAGINIKW